MHTLVYSILGSSIILILLQRRRKVLKSEGPIVIKRSFDKGQLISKCLFAVFTFFQNTNENKSTSSKVEFVRSFFERNVGLKKPFRIC